VVLVRVGAAVTGRVACSTTGDRKGACCAGRGGSGSMCGSAPAALASRRARGSCARATAASRSGLPALGQTLGSGSQPRARPSASSWARVTAGGGGENAIARCIGGGLPACAVRCDSFATSAAGHEGHAHPGVFVFFGVRLEIECARRMCRCCCSASPGGSKEDQVHATNQQPRCPPLLHHLAALPQSGAADGGSRARSLSPVARVCLFRTKF
jgi:hypothetical protein